MPDGSRRSRFVGLAGVAIRRAITRSVESDRAQTWLSVAGVAVSVALMLLVTSIGLGLAGGTALHGSAVDYAIAPEGGQSSVVADVENARLGNAHETAAGLAGRDDVTAATPIRTAMLQIRVDGGEPTRLLVIGVVPSSDVPEIVGLSTDSLSPGDPYYANGSYDGRWTGEAVLSAAGADATNATEGSVLAPASGRTDRSFAVTAIRAPSQPGIGQFPVAVVHLGELQALVGGTNADAADQILVAASDSDVETALEDVYPRSTVISRGDLFGGSDSELPLAISVTAFIIAVAVGTLFTMTTMGFELAAGSTERAVMAALGVSRSSRALIVAVQALAVTVLGGIIGVVLWILGLSATNAISVRYISDLPIAVFRPELAIYGLAVAVLIGLFTLPYLLFVSARTTGVEGHRF